MMLSSQFDGALLYGSALIVVLLLGLDRGYRYRPVVGTDSETEIGMVMLVLLCLIEWGFALIAGRCIALGDVDRTDK